MIRKLFNSNNVEAIIGISPEKPSRRRIYLQVWHGFRGFAINFKQYVGNTDEINFIYIIDIAAQNQFRLQRRYCLNNFSEKQIYTRT